MTEHHFQLLPVPKAVKTLHAILGASNAHRWLECPASVRMERMFPDKAGKFAEEGTIAHELGSYCLKNNCNAHDAPALPGTDPMTDTWVSDLWDAEMRDHIQTYLDYVRLICNGDLLVEMKVDYSRWAPDGFGTSDAIRVNTTRRTVHVADLKYGTGVKVYAEENAQGKMYALGVLNDLMAFYDPDDIETFEIIVFQPRLDHIDTWTTTKAELLKWADEYVTPRAKLALTEDAPFNPGEKQCQFCRAKGNCKARRDANMTMAVAEFGNVPAVFTLSPHDISSILKRADEFKRWIAAIEEHAFKQALQGTPPPGFKLVAGRSNRRIINPEMFVQALELEGHEPDQIYEPRKLVGLGKLEALLGKKNPLLKEFTMKPSGAPVLVPVSDKRPALEHATAQDDFKGVNVESLNSKTDSTEEI